MSDPGQLRAFTYARQLLGDHRAASAATALNAVVGVYSSHPTAPLSLRVRTTGLTAAKFRRLDAVRLPAMRGSIHLLPAKTAHLAFHALRETPAQRAARLRYFKLTPAQVDEAAPKLTRAATAPITLDDAREVLGEGLDAKGVVAQLCRDGVMARVAADGLRSNALRYRAVELPAADRDEALAWLAGEYLRAFGPARAKDFQWWAGTKAGPAKAALAEHDTVDVGDGHLLHARDERAYARATPPKGSVDLLPKWDMLTMGWPKDGRGRIAGEDRAAQCYDFRGDGLPVVLVDGQAAGTWSPALDAKEPVTYFDGKPGPKLRRAVERELDDVRAFLAGQPSEDQSCGS